MWNTERKIIGNIQRACQMHQTVLIIMLLEYLKLAVIQCFFVNATWLIEGGERWCREVERSEEFLIGNRCSMSPFQLFKYLFQGNRCVQLRLHSSRWEIWNRRAEALAYTCLWLRAFLISACHEHSQCWNPTLHRLEGCCADRQLSVKLTHRAGRSILCRFQHKSSYPANILLFILQETNSINLHKRQPVTMS